MASKKTTPRMKSATTDWRDAASAIIDGVAAADSAGKAPWYMAQITKAADEAAAQDSEIDQLYQALSAQAKLIEMLITKRGK